MSDEPPLEKELKFRAPDLPKVREQLLHLEAERLAPSGAEDNLVLDREGALEGDRCLLRLRTDRHGARLTFKGPVRHEGKLRVREEHEVRADDPKALLAILERLGFEVVARYQKQREEWRLGGVTVALDRTPIGDFIEFEGDGARKVAERCGFDPGEAETKSYLEIYRQYRKSHPDAPADMVFT